MSEPVELGELDLTNLPWANDAEWEALLLIEHPQAKQYEAYKWLCAYVDQINGQITAGNENGYEDYTHSEIDVYELIEIGKASQNGGWGEYICKGGIFEGESTDPLFWPMVNRFLGVPNVDYGGIFSCSC